MRAAKHIMTGYMLRTKDMFDMKNVIAVNDSSNFVSNTPYWTFDAALPACIV